MAKASTSQAPASLNTTQGLAADLRVSAEERVLLRDLAKQVAELAHRPIEAEKAKLWTAHNDLETTQPLIFIDPENGWNEIITQDKIQCQHPLLCAWEMRLRKEIYWATHMKDDRVIEPYFDVEHSYTDTKWGLAETDHMPDQASGAKVWDSPIEDYERDMAGMRVPEVIIDEDETDQIHGLAQELMGDILTVRLRTKWWWTLGMTWDFIRLRGLENLMMDMYDHPDGVHALMAFMRDGMMQKIDSLESRGLLSLNTEGTYVGSGGFGWTNQLPQAEFAGHVRTMDMWGFAESQETVGVRPSMFAEFIFPYQKTLLERFGLNCYGCCEPVNNRWSVIEAIPRLRRVSASPWADMPAMSEYLGQDYILSIKPSPTPLSLPQLDEEAARDEIRRDLEQTRGNVVELIMKDNHTLGGNARNATRWVEIVREEIARVS